MVKKPSHTTVLRPTCKILWTQTLLLVSSHAAERIQAACLGLGTRI
jgi:hypothetical protein